VLLLSFRQAQERHSQQISTAIGAALATDTVPPPPPPPPPPKKVDVKVKVPPPAPPMPKAPTLVETRVNEDFSDTLVTDVSVSTKPVVIKSITDVKTKVEMKGAIAKVELKTPDVKIKPLTELRTDVKPITHVKPVKSVIVTSIDRVDTLSGFKSEVAEGEEVLVVKNTTTKEQLEQMKKDLQDKGYVFTIKDASYSDNKVVSIKAVISKGDDWGSIDANHFERFSIRYIPGKNPRFTVALLHGRITFKNSAE
jgi:hypothetical protein